MCPGRNFPTDLKPSCISKFVHCLEIYLCKLIILLKTTYCAIFIQLHKLYIFRGEYIFQSPESRGHTIYDWFEYVSISGILRSPVVSFGLLWSLVISFSVLRGLLCSYAVLQVCDFVLSCVVSRCCVQLWS